MKKKSAQTINPVLVFITSIVVAQLSGLIGSLFTFSAIPTWYRGLEKPFFTPPNYLFGPVWLVLYTLMGIAAGLLYITMKKGGKNSAMATVAFQLYGIQLALNAIWTPVFFGAKQLLLGFVIIGMLDLFIFLLTVFSLRFDKRVSFLLLPYLVWVTYAMVLNGTLWYLNP